LKAQEPHDLQLLLAAVKRALRIERTQIAIDAPSETHIGKPIGILPGCHQSLLRRQLLVECEGMSTLCFDSAEQFLDFHHGARRHSVGSERHEGRRK
jgi:hypothetical protein